MSYKVRALTEPLTLGEGPHWSQDQQALYFVDLLSRTIHKYSLETEKHTQTALDEGPNFIIPVEGTRDQFVVGAGRRFLIIRWDGEDGSAVEVTQELGQMDQHRPGNRINDGKVDPRGRLFAANLTYIFDLRKNDIDGAPDGMTIDRDGNIWFAVYLGSCVLKVDPRTGKLLEKIAIPVNQVTSVTFGGPNYDILFVTTGRMALGSEEQPPPSGATFMVTGLGVKGHPNANFKL